MYKVYGVEASASDYDTGMDVILTGFSKEIHARNMVEVLNDLRDNMLRRSMRRSAYQAWDGEDDDCVIAIKELLMHFLGAEFNPFDFFHPGSISFCTVSIEID